MCCSISWWALEKSFFLLPCSQARSETLAPSASSELMKVMCCRSSIACWTGSGKSWVAEAGHYLFIQEKCHDKWLYTSLSPCRMDLFIYLKFIFIHLAGGDYKNISLISTVSGIYADTRFGVVTNHTIYCLLQCPNTFPPPSPSQSN